MTTIRTVPLLVLAGCLFAACSFEPKPSIPVPVAELPADFEESVDVGAPEPLEWWRAFSDPVLDAVVDSVLTSNFDLAEAVARVEQARLGARIAKAAMFPVLQAEGSATDADSPTNAGVGAQLLGSDGEEDGPLAALSLPERLAFTTYSLSLGFAYELDFWGRARNDARAAGAQYMASESDFHAARIGILAETIGTYFEIVDLRRRTALARETVDVLVERERLVTTRYDGGLATSFELYQVRQDLRNTQAALPQMESLLAEAEARLSVLLGGYRANMEAIMPDSLAPSPVADPPPAGIPAGLLLQRPDLLAARHRLEAARYGIGARRAELLPTLSLSGSIGFQSTETTGLFDVDQWFRNLAANLLGPIFDGGRRQNNVALAHARFNEAAAAYGRTVVTAVNEVEAALAGLRKEGRRYAFLASQREEAQASADLRARRYTSGVGRYADYLDALRNLLNVESALAGAERDLALSRLAVHRALGGGWTAGAPLAGPPMIPAQPGRKGEDK